VKVKNNPCEGAMNVSLFLVLIARMQSITVSVNQVMDYEIVKKYLEIFYKRNFNPSLTITFCSWLFKFKVREKIHVSMKKQNLKFFLIIIKRHYS
jgi:hypothetical protein